MLTFVLFHAFMGVRTVIGDYTSGGLRTLPHDAPVPRRHRPVRHGHDGRRHPPVCRKGARMIRRPRRPRRRRRRRRPVGRPRARQGRRRRGRPDQALPDPLPHRRRPGRRLCRPGQPGGGPLGVAHVRHHQGWRLPGRPGRGRGARPRGHRDGDRARAHGPAVQPDAGRARSTSAASAATPATTARARSSGPASPPTAPAT